MNTDILSFLTQLAENNSKEWMDANKDWYLRIKEQFLKEVSFMLGELVEIEPGLGSLKPKDCVFRQNRDIRFSSNKAPYKSNLAAYFAVGGKKSTGPGYYLHIQPGESFMAGGIWMPGGETLKKIRKEIDYTGQELLDIIGEKQFKSFFGEIEGERLKTSPREFDEAHPFIALLRYKSFIVSRPLEDRDVLSGNYPKLALEAFVKMKPFTDYLAKAVEQVDGGEGLF